MTRDTKTIAVIGALKLDMHLTREQPLPPGANIDEGAFPLKDEAAIEGITTAITAYQTLCRVFARGRLSWNPDVRMVSVIGSDDYTEKVIAKVKEFGIGTQGIKIMPDKETYATFHVLTKSTGETKHHRHDNPATPACWTKEDFENAQSFGGDRKPDLIVISTQLEEEVFAKILTCAKNNNIEVFLGKAPSYSIAKSLFQHITYFVVDGIEEAERVSSEKSEKSETSETSEKEPGYESAEKLIEWGVKNVIITEGHERARYMLGPFKAHQWGFFKFDDGSEEKYTDYERDRFTGAFAANLLAFQGKISIGTMTTALKYAGVTVASDAQSAGTTKG